MARATRSQKPAKASQAQPSQTQRSQKRRAEDPEEEDEDDEEEEEEARNMDVDDDERGGGDDIDRMANALVRLAMFTEHKRVPLRREEITKKVLGPNGRAFARVFSSAQTILRTTLGMEMVELRSRAELDKDTAPPGTNKEGDLEEARKATGVKKKAAAAGSKTYILRSTLNEAIIKEAAITHEAILEAEAADAPSDDEDDDDFGGSAAYGSIISWSAADQLGSLGVLYVILALILVSGRVVGDQDLRMMLTRLRLPATGTIAFSAAATHRTLTLDAYLSLLLRQSFLDRQQVGEAGKASKAKGKRSRVSQGADDAGGQAYEWRWGARAQSEVGEQAIAAFVAEFMVGDEGVRDEGDDEEEGGAVVRARADKRRVDAESNLAKMVKGIERAAGGQLSDIK
ncbi:MAGE-domain-containing protein [Mycena belliarum]|uniref:MAGE-domain-containing protein n=1 Tax=Mycena belliarum TaxID=1033014 RepID=A0AAD6UH85_9AGAR|nr:MAGE-domain-containing protein [Mycena belliae]